LTEEELAVRFRVKSFNYQGAGVLENNIILSPSWEGNPRYGDRQQGVDFLSEEIPTLMVNQGAFPQPITAS